MSENTSTATQEAPAAEPAAEEKPVNTDTFSNCTSRCSRRAWNIFLEYRDDIEVFKTKEVRGKLTFANESAAQAAKEVLTSQGGVKYITQTAEVLEFTGTLAATQLVLKQPDTTGFDALKVE